MNMLCGFDRKLFLKKQKNLLKSRISAVLYVCYTTDFYEVDIPYLGWIEHTEYSYVSTYMHAKLNINTKSILI